MNPIQRPANLAIAIAALLLGSSRSAESQPEPERRVDSLFAQPIRGLSPGVAVAVVRDGKVLLSKGYGMANLEHRAPITDSTVFDVASVSKQFTGLAVAMLVEQGRIRLSDDIRKYLPELADFGRVITIDHLVHHTSGLRDWPGSLTLAGWVPEDVVSFSQILTFAANQRTLNFIPGAEYTYSNTGFNLLAEMVARVSGKSFRAWTDEQLFRPLGMTRSHFHDDHTEVIPNRAFGYGPKAGGGFRTITDNLTAQGSSSLFTTAADLARWVMNFDDPKVAGSAALARSRTRGVLNDGSSIPYAFGISHGEYRGRPTLSHGGSWAGFSTAVVHFPEQRFGVIVLGNSPIVPATRAAYQIADIFIDADLGPRPQPATDPLATAPSVAVPSAVLDGYVGVYRLGPGWYLRIRRDGAELKAQASREAEGALVPKSDTSFWAPAYNASLTFHRSAGNGAVELSYRGQRTPRLPDRPGLDSDLREFIGTFESDELGASYQVEVKDGTLVLRHRRHGTIPLTRFWKDDFGAATGFLRSVEFLRDRGGRVTGFSVFLGERSRDIRFTRRIQG
jgi:CubicO group peptidase (beta-lactamase class C family)